MDWYAISSSEVLRILKTSEEGLSLKEVKKRLNIYGYNILKFKRKNVLLGTLKDNFTSPLLLLLIFASILSYLVGELKEAVAIMIIIYLYITFDYIQRRKSEKIVSLLKQSLETKVKVRRGNKLYEILSRELVPGDVVILEAGDKVPADIRIFESRSLYVDESALTGESKSVYKEDKVYPKETPIPERRNMLFMGSYVVRGYAEGVVVSTGKNTVFGKMFEKVSEEEHKKTVLEKEIDRFGKVITIITVMVILFTFVLSITTGILKLTDAILFAIALGVAVIPEGLPAMLTIIFTISMYRIYKAGAIVKRLSSVDALGEVDVIVTDKTGTLTMNKLTASKFYFNNKLYEVTGKGYEPKGQILSDNEQVNLNEIKIFLETCLNSCKSELVYDEEEGWEVIGDPLEGALICLAMKGNVNKKFEVVNVFEFDRSRKRMSVIVNNNRKLVAYIKGAPESLLNISKYIYWNNNIVELNSEIKNKIENVIQNFAKKGYRIIAVGFKEINGKDIHNIDIVERDIIFLGVVALEDPIREDVKDAIDFARRAGIDIYILTGDHPFTAKTIAEKLGITSEVILANDLKKLSDEEVYNKLKEFKIIARADPEDKYRIVKIFKNKNKIVAMTGDGVNDAPALKLAHIGIALADGTDIAKEAADMVLLNNSFKSIIEAIKEGRRIFHNMRTFLTYVLSLNMALMSNVMFVFFFFERVVFNAIQILYINLVVETINSISISEIPVKKDMLLKKIKKKIVDKVFLTDFYIVSTLIGFPALLIASFLIHQPNISSLVIFYLIFSQYSILIYYYSKEGLQFFKSKLFLITFFVTLLLQISVFIIGIGKFINLKPLSPLDLLLEIYLLGITYLVAYFSPKILKLNV